MLRVQSFVLVALVSSFFSACGDTESVVTAQAAGASGTAGTSGTSGTAGSGGTGGAGAAGTAGSSGTGGTSGTSGTGGTGGGSSCAVGAVASSTIGADGGFVTLCDARVDVPAGALDASGTVAIEIVDPPAPAPFEREFLGHVFAFSVEGASLSQNVKLSLPRDPSATGIVDLALWSETDTAWFALEPCPEGNDVLSIMSGLPATFTLLRDVNTYPPGPSGLGSGQIDLTFQGQTSTWSVDEAGGYAIFEQAPLSRSVYLVTQRNVGSFLEQLDIRFNVPSDAPASILSVSWLSTDPSQPGWSWLEPIHGAANAFNLTEPTTGSYDGSFDVTVHNDPSTLPMSATFSITPQKFRYPSEISCGGG